MPLDSETWDPRFPEVAGDHAAQNNVADPIWMDQDDVPVQISDDSESLHP